MVKDTIDQFDIDIANIYNMDQTGFAIASMESTQIIVKSSSRTYWQANPGRQGRVSVIDCICADGAFTDPMVKISSEGNRKSSEFLSLWMQSDLFQRIPEYGPVIFMVWNA